MCDLDPQATLGDVAGLRLEEGFKPDLMVSNYLLKYSSGEVLVDVWASMHNLRGALARADRVIIPVSPGQA